ncbi:coxsackievirus and adenovirus receptor homolog [Pseudoliparis swirei]|uniref:coxsackievirus and adenovirus receptor homolog n=1 Tax=Pseudoliparis swirei TaxID=2059687 RepID=UPI0024BE6A40|nr:coxsackievirus and adenovirus receptor homolog [Pseudoliparis swirei]
MSGDSRSRLRAAFFPPWWSASLLCAASLLTTEWKCARGMRVTSTGPQTIHQAEGGSVSLGCRYTASPSDSGELDIEWTAVSPDATHEDQTLLSYTSGTIHIHGYLALARGLRFAAPDPSTGDASISIAPLSPAHSATYRCKVRKSPGVDTRKVTLVVMVKPSVPECWVEGAELVGGAVSLHCKSWRGSAPLEYSWRRESAAPLPAASTQDVVTGELRITNHSQSNAGFYRCEAHNAAGAQHCGVSLRAERPPNRAAILVGTAVGSLLFIFVLLVFIGILYWKLSDRHVVTGELRITNHSQSNAGFYRCEAHNAAGAQHCRVSLRAERPPNRAAILVGTAVGSLLFIFVLLVFIGILYWKLSDRRRSEEL